MSAILLIAVLPYIGPSDIRLELAASKARLVQGEPTKLLLTWTALRSIEVVEGRETILLNSGSGYRPYEEAVFSEKTSLRAAEALAPGTIKRTAYEIAAEEVDGETRPSVRLAFPTPGTYRFKVEYEGASSNEIAVEVVAPSGADQQFFANELRSHPELLTPWITLRDSAQAALVALLAQQPASVYLARPRLIVTPLLFGEAVKRDIARGIRPANGEARAVYEELLALDFAPTAFGDSHALLLAQLAEELYGVEQAVPSFRAVVDAYPSTPAADIARAWLQENAADTTAPVLISVAASPASLWPPNHKLVPITVAVQVSDDRDPNPAVKLVSITCDDACDPAGDVSGAAYGTDDRQFDLRSERKGTSAAGRTYTITYSVEDAAGNRTTATTTVTVPHDQGSKK